MGLILHLTDLHLGSLDERQILDDYKSDIVALPERTSRHTLLRSTLKALGRYLLAEKKTLDAIVTSGDITIANGIDGFEALPDVLNELGEACPPPERIVIVPGNHDVTWRTPASVPARYDNFLKYIRSNGYITPFLDGVDLNDSRGEIEYSGHYLTLDGGRVQLIPINSSNYCGTLEPLASISEEDWQRILGLLNCEDSAAIEKELMRLRLQDVIRISPLQLDTLSRLIQSLDPDRHDEVGHSGVVRIGVMHHHIGAISTNEEFKPYESVINLGLLKNFLRSNRFNMLLHGHKHDGSVYWEHLDNYDKQSFGSYRSHRVLVVAGSTIGGTDSRRMEVCRLIEIDAKTTAPNIIITSVPAVDPGGKLEGLRPRRFALWDDRGIIAEEGIKTISAESVDEVYDRLLALFDGLPQHKELKSLVCEVRQVPEKVTPPLNYPKIPGESDEERQERFEQLVKWWQRKKTAQRYPPRFTHGERISAYGPEKVDQIAEAAQALKKRKDTSKAIIILYNPSIDTSHDRRLRSPHFCLAQMVIVEKPNGALALDCIAFFRKQEMRYWWPVNIAELAHLQNEVMERISDEYKGIERGSITTIAATAYASTSPPKVAVPIVDYWFDEDPDQLWRLAHVLFFYTSMPEKIELREKWRVILKNLIPDPKPDPDGGPVAVAGLDYLYNEIARLLYCQHIAEIGELNNLLGRLLQENLQYIADTKVDPPNKRRHAQWHGECTRLVNRTLDLIDRVFERRMD